MSGKETPEVFILHGWSVSTENEKKWLPFMQALRERGLKPVFLPLPGLSSPLSTAWNLDDYVEWLEQQLLGKRDLILLGHSFGGQLAIRFAATHARQIKKIILIAPSGIIDRSLPKQFKRVIFGTLAKVGKRVFPTEFGRKLLYRLAREQDYYQAPSTMRQTMIQVTGQEVKADAAQLHVPTLLVWGENDKVTPLWMGQLYHSLIRKSSLTVVAGARHSPQYTHVEASCKVIVQWLKSPKSPTM